MSPIPNYDILSYNDTLSAFPTSLQMADGDVPFFAKSQAAAPVEESEPTLEEEVAALTEEEVAKTVKVSNLRNANGVDYAPWMKMTAEDERKIQQVMKVLYG